VHIAQRLPKRKRISLEKGATYIVMRQCCILATIAKFIAKNEFYTTISIA
jgi:hypothetical protein